MKIGIVNDKGTYFNGSGIHTFVAHSTALFDLLNVDYDFIHTTRNSNTGYVPTRTDDGNYLKDTMNVIKQYIDDQNPDILLFNEIRFITYCYKFMRNFPDMRFIYYNHCSGTFKENNPELTNLHTLQYKYNNLEVFTCNNNNVKFLKRAYNINSKFAVQPFINENMPERTEDDGRFKIISTDYPRKMIPSMIKYAHAKNMNVDIYGKINDEDILRLITKDDTVQLIPNDKILDTIKNGHALLQFATLEMCPYSMLEASFYMPVIIQHDYPWNVDLPFNVIHTTDNLDVYIKTDYESYTTMMIDNWNTILKLNCK